MKIAKKVYVPAIIVSLIAAAGLGIAANKGLIGLPGATEEASSVTIEEPVALPESTKTVEVITEPEGFVEPTADEAATAEGK